MVSRFALVCTVGLVAVTARDAHALKPAAHADITFQACRSAGLGVNFCTRIATEDFNTDAREWEDMSAHAQIPATQTACEAADAAVGRVWLRATEIRAAFIAVRSGMHTDDDVAAADRALGRLLHTVQDQCAHHGMPNPQHAWFSLSDFCDGTTLSPDIQQSALTCARAETGAIMAGVAASVRAGGLATVLDGHSCPEDPYGGNDRNQGPPVCDRRFLPGLFDACGFFGEAESWDGIDRQWDGGRVAMAMRAGFTAGLAGQGIGPRVCGGDERVLSPATSQPIVDVAGGTPSCAQAHLVCLGKADGGEDVPNPFDDPDDPNDSTNDTAGCAASGGHGAGSALLLVLLVLGRVRFASRRRVR